MLIRFFWLLLAMLWLGAPIQAREVQLEVTPANPVMLAGGRQKAYLKVGLIGFALPSETARTPVNIAIVLDKSGSMEGEKLFRAREAALMALNRLNAEDIASVISYDSTVQVVLPATRLTDRSTVARALGSIQAGGNTALFAGVARGAAEVRKFLDGDRVNRIILLSDGLANVGPSSPQELGRLGASLAKEGVSVSTIGLGLGYNEDLMAQLAGMSDGNHAFVESADDLARIFTYELGDVLSVVAQDVEVEIRCLPGVQPLQVLGRDAEIVGQTVRTTLNQLYGEQEKFVLLELDIPPSEVDGQQMLADVEVRYRNMLSGAQDVLNATTGVRFTASLQTVLKSADQEAMSSVVEQIANHMSKEAVALRDAGRKEEAQQQLQESAEYVRKNAELYDSEKLHTLGKDLEEDASAVTEDGEWNRTRKALRKKQHSRDMQQTY